MFNTTTKWLSIAPPTIAHFRCGWDSNPWVPFMLHYLLQPHRKNLHMFNLKPTNPLDSLSGFKTSANRSMRFCINPMLSTSDAMINTKYCTSFRWETRSGYICRKIALQGPIGRSVHFIVDLLQPYFPPLLDTSKITEQLKPTNLHPNFMEQTSTKQIVDTHVKGTRQ
jgi:hypothetical protein